MDIKIIPIDYQNMTWKEVFETIQKNMATLYNAILASYTDVEIEQYKETGTTIEVQSPVDKDTEWLIFKNNDYLGKRDGGPGYSVSGQVITFEEPLTILDQVTIMITNGNGIAVLANRYVESIKYMYDHLDDLDIDITKQIERVISIKHYLDESAEAILDSKTVCAAYKDYIDQLIHGTTPDHGDYADEMVAARRQYPLLGARLDNFLATCFQKRTFMDSYDFRDGDWVVVKDGEELYMYMVKDEYSGEMPHETMRSGQIAVNLFSTESYEDTRSLTRRVTELEQQVAAMKPIVEEYNKRVLMDLSIKDN